MEEKNVDPFSESSQYDNHLIFRIARYGLKHQFFSVNQLIIDLGLDEHSKDYVRHTLVSNANASGNPNHMIVLVLETQTTNTLDGTYALLPNAIIQYVDYLEIVAARKTATEARRTANKAYIISIVAIVISVVLGIVEILLS